MGNGLIGNGQMGNTGASHFIGKWIIKWIIKINMNNLKIRKISNYINFILFYYDELFLFILLIS